MNMQELFCILIILFNYVINLTVFIAKLILLVKRI